MMGGGGEGVGLDAVQQALYLCFPQPNPFEQWQNVRKVEPKRMKMKNKPNRYNSQSCFFKLQHYRIIYITTVL